MRWYVNAAIFRKPLTLNHPPTHTRTQTHHWSMFVVRLTGLGINKENFACVIIYISAFPEMLNSISLQLAAATKALLAVSSVCSWCNRLPVSFMIILVTPPPLTRSLLVFLCKNVEYLLDFHLLAQPLRLRPVNNSWKQQSRPNLESSRKSQMPNHFTESWLCNYLSRYVSLC